MAFDDRELLDILKFELAFLEQGGYGRSVRMPQKPSSIFQDSPSCLNFDDASRPHPCNECMLMQYVPEKLRTENVPCHHIPLDSRGRTVDDLAHNQAKLEDTMAAWLRRQIEVLEQKLAGQPQA